MAIPYQHFQELFISRYLALALWMDAGMSQSSAARGFRAIRGAEGWHAPNLLQYFRSLFTVLIIDVITATVDAINEPLVFSRGICLIMPKSFPVRNKRVFTDQLVTRKSRQINI